MCRVILTLQYHQSRFFNTIHENTLKEVKNTIYTDTHSISMGMYAIFISRMLQNGFIRLLDMLQLAEVMLEMKMQDCKSIKLQIKYTSYAVEPLLNVLDLRLSPI
jgi:hypothetical protein